MTKLRTLKQSAKQSAEYRGHKLGRFYTLDTRGIAQASCRQCSMSVMVNTRPQPNGIDIAGGAVALNCDHDGCTNS